MKVELTINGGVESVEVAPSTTLLDLIRDRLGLKGTKEYCRSGVCGACTVLMDGQAVSSCSLLAGQANGADILTIEGLRPTKGCIRFSRRSLTISACSAATARRG